MWMVPVRRNRRRRGRPAERKGGNPDTPLCDVWFPMRCPRARNGLFGRTRRADSGHCLAHRHAVATSRPEAEARANGLEVWPSAKVVMD